MKILEVKNNLVKISYTAQDNLVISGFVIIEDLQYAYVAQVMSLKADSGFNYAIVKLLFTFNDEGVVKNYNGSIPDLDANITTLTSDELLDILPIETPLTIGKLAQQKFILNVDFSVLEKNLLVCSDNVENTDILVSNLAKQITANNCKSIIFDNTSTIKAENRLTFSQDFKLPLNYDTINFIYEHDLNDIEPSSKAIIQDILIEVQEYANTLIDKFIPFDLFVNVIDSQYKQTNMPELALLKSRLLKYSENNIFAQEAKEFQSFRAAMRGNLSTLIDLSKVDSVIQKLVMSYVYDVINNSDLFVYSIVKIDNENSDKKLMKKFITQNKIFTTVICPHNYKYIHELKEIANNLILFTPQTIQHDFAAYNVFLSKLNPDECIVYGKATQNIPLILELLPYEDLTKLEEEYSASASNVEPNSEADTDSFSESTDTYSQESMINDSIENNVPQEQTEESNENVAELQNNQEETSESSEFEQHEENSDVLTSEKEQEFVEEENPQVDDFNEQEFVEDENPQVDDFNEQEFVEEENPQVDDFNEQEFVEEENPQVDDFNEQEFVEDENPQVDDFQPDAPLQEEADILTEQDLDYIDTNVNLEENNSTVFEESEIEQQNFSDDIDDFNSENNIDSLDNLSETFNDNTENQNQEDFDNSIAENTSKHDEISLEEFMGNDDNSNVVPIYPVEDDSPIRNEIPEFEQGDRISHPKYGEGVVEKMVKFGNKVLCSINFANGRRLLDPTISQLEKI